MVKFLLSKSWKAIFVVGAILALVRGTCLCTGNSLGWIKEDTNGDWSLQFLCGVQFLLSSGVQLALMMFGLTTCVISFIKPVCTAVQLRLRRSVCLYVCFLAG